MQYTSPIRTLNLEEFVAHDKSALNMAKKKLLAEVELSETATILRGGQELTKDDILKLFDNLSQGDGWQNHLLIAQDADLLAFLEKGELTRKMTFEERSEYASQAFIAFVSPYFATSFQKQLLLALEKRELARLKKLYEDLPNLMTYYDRENVHFAAQQWVETLCHEIETVSKNIDEGDYLSKKDLAKFTDDRLINCLNYMGSTLDAHRDTLALTLYNLSASLWNRFLRKKAYLVNYAALKLVCSQHITATLSERSAYFRENSSNDWIVFYWKMYHLSFLNRKPKGFMRVVAWLIQLIALPVVLCWRAWVSVSAFLDRYVLGRIVSAIGNFTLALATILYTFFLFISLLSIPLTLIKTDNPKAASGKRGIHEDLPLVIISLQDSVKKYEQQLKEPHMSDEEAFVTRAMLVRYRQRKDLYERAFAKLKALNKSLIALLNYNPAEDDKAESLKKARNIRIPKTSDSIIRYQDVLSRVVYHNATIRDLAYKLREKDPEKYKNINWDNLDDARISRKAQIAFDSIAFYDAYLRDFLLENRY